ncbi:NAD(P)-dependent dehydrogenase, short-chain alcohol dehydrogenase family [Agreia bicolorata]|uniref:NAD(P)-dependent dehydrogenase, short-chain alcohol dehydrogenase family n=1 Tax=Agreia bicolorata TaxID=110935 RepID=A0A1T4YEI5_9MICO|nr:SDR family oxidoreductase [Agreia bicolorata]SKB00113.1 NAD(P)-dependent dehydrogenase, short-chain alcohol dehydrogenase family [Agreia bicolorata]
MSDNVVVVVGVGGMGEAIARQLGTDAHVVLADFSQAALDRVSAALDKDGINTTAHLVDVSSHESVASLARDAAALGPITKVAWTAGLSPVQAPVAAILKVDLAGVAFGLEEFGKVIADGGAGVVIASMAGTMAAEQLPAEIAQALQSTPSDDLLSLPFLAAGAVPDPNAAYGIAKRANQLRVRSASLSWGARGARINSISPGIIATPMGEQELAGDSGAMMRAMIKASGTGRIGNPGDILKATSFLLSDEASFITGTDLLVDGGVVAAINSGALQMPTD